MDVKHKTRPLPAARYPLLARPAESREVHVCLPPGAHHVSYTVCKYITGFYCFTVHFCSLSFSPTYALIYIIKILSQAVTLIAHFTPTCFDPYGSSSGSTLHNTVPSTRITYAAASPKIQTFKLLIL